MQTEAKPHRHPTVRLRTITLLSVTLALLISVGVCIAVFTSVYSKTVLRDAQVNAVQAVEQTATAVGNSLDSMKAKLTAISGSAKVMTFGMMTPVVMSISYFLLISHT